MNLYKLHSKPEALDHHDMAFEQVPELVWEKYAKEPAELKKRETALAKDPHTAYGYARNVLEGPFLAGEAAIATVAYYAYWYALVVMKKPWPACEAAIRKDAWLSYSYARDIVSLPEDEARKWRLLPCAESSNAAVINRA